MRLKPAVAEPREPTAIDTIEAAIPIGKLKVYPIIERRMFEPVFLGIAFGSPAAPFDPPEFSVERQLSEV